MSKEDKRFTASRARPLGGPSYPMPEDVERVRHKADSLERDLVNGFAHEVKNPLASMRSALRILAEKVPEEDANRAVIDQLYEQVIRLNKTVSELVDFTRIASPKTCLADINGILKQVLQDLHPECLKRDVRVEEQFLTNLPQLEIDPSQLKLALFHLILDMLRAMPNGGQLLLRSSLDPGNNILLEIEDTGSPIPGGHMERLFKPFLSVHGRNAGVGLASVKRIVNLNGGSIEARNQGEKGMLFRIIFPFSP